MKRRTAFVANSSSSSFLVEKRFLSPHQVEQIHNHSEEGKRLLVEFDDDPWSITETSLHIRGETNMDNFDMHEFLEKIGVDTSKVQWSESYMPFLEAPSDLELLSGTGGDK